MEKIDIILDRVSKFEFKNISNLDKSYLENYGSDTIKDIDTKFEDRFKYYQEVSRYDNEDILFYNPNVDINNIDVKNVRLNILWDIIVEDDLHVFCRVYKIPYMVSCLEWSHISEKYRVMFDDYWKSYYGFNI